MAQKSPNVTVNPNMAAFTPNVTIQPGTNMITSYNMPFQMNGYRMQQPMNPYSNYIANASFMNQAQLPVQMMPMNMHPQAAANFQQQMSQSGQQPNPAMYSAYGYINGGIPPQAFNMNPVMRR